jgi:hypothetical protein
MENHGLDNKRIYAVTSIYAGISIFDPNIKALDMSKLKPISVSELSAESYQRFVSAQESFLEGRHSQPADTSKNPTYKEYTTVTVNGKIVAEIDNHGWVKTSNSVGGQIHRLFSDETNGLNGPGLAQQRAEKIAELLGGGTLEKASTAMTQAQFKSTPQPRSTTDYQAMKEDPAYEQLQKTKHTRTLFLAQQMAQESAQTTTSDEGESAQSTVSASGAVNAFLEYMSKTPEERYYEALLAEEGLTKEQLEALPPDERAKIEAKIQEKIKQRVENNMEGVA